MIFRVYHQTLGGHVHMKFYAGVHEGALGKCGNLTMRIEEFAIFKSATKFIQFVDARPSQPSIRSMIRSPSTDPL